MIIDITPMGAVRQNQADRWKHRPAVLRYHAFRDELRLKLPGYELGMSLDIKFCIPMPKSWSEKKREANAGQYHDQKPDIDNLVKSFMDTFGTEDKHVAVLHAEKYWAYQGSIEVL